MVNPCRNIVLLLVSIVLIANGEARASDSSFRLTNQQTDGWTIDYTPSGFQTTILDIDGVPHLQFVEGNSEDGKSGGPQLPIEAISLGIPPNASITAHVIDPQYEEVPNQLVAPVGQYVYTETNERQLVYRKSAKLYNQNRLFPVNQLTITHPYRVRQQNIATIRIFPYQYNPVTKILRRITRATLQIRLASIDGRPMDTNPASVRGADPHFEDEYKSLVWNYDQAKQWRLPIRSGISDTPNDSTRDWFEVGRTYYRVNIANDGWHKITTSDLRAAGANTSQIDVPSLKMFGKGVEVPILVRPDTTIEFYAVHNYGDSTYIDTFTDTSAYFLTWGGTPGLRFSPALQPGGTVGANVVSAKVTRHLEQNNGYFYGVGDAEVSNNDVMPGEGWAWGNPSEWFYPTTTREFPFAVDSIDIAGVLMARIRARTFGTTGVNNPGPDHDARFWLNDSLVGEIFFEARTEGRLDTLFSASWLRDSSKLRVTSVPTQTNPNQFYLDWFEIDYQRFLRARNNQLYFTSEGPTGPNPTQFTVVGFSNPQIDVLDLTTRRTITGGNVTGDSTNGYAIQFKDTSSTAKNYFVVAAGGQMSVGPLSRKVFTDIRVNTQGADYIIITHRTFLVAAQRLAAHRQTVNQVRTRVIDVQDIYDEFNYGVMNGTKLKDFLRYAYLNWQAPAPTYLLLFGDASWDFHKYLSTSTQTNFVPGYGVPTGDNWFACFNPDTNFIPSMLIGRIPSRDSIQAQRTVDKTIGYDGYTLGDWNKKYMFVAGLNFNSESTINSYVTPPPLAGIPYRVYKTTPAVIDGEHKQEMRDLVRDGLVFINFLGHSGGRIWEVDIGDPNTLENTNGRLPFLVSVSCNVGAYAEPANPLLAEDFMLADNCGAIASWASSTEGWAGAGVSLVNFFLTGVRIDSIRELGSLTNTARVRLWQTYGNYYIYIASVKCNPLLGDPLARLAIPLRPDLALTGPDISVNIPTPTPNDSTLTVRVNVHNYGLVPSDSVGMTLTDLYNGQTTHLLNNAKIAPTRNVDSIYVRWDAADNVGRHTLTATVDPLNAIPEVNELNNTGAAEQYVYANLLAVVKPLNNMAVLPGPQTLVVTSPLGLDSLGFQYFFELDTVATFDSPFLVQSGAVAPGPVKGEWTTPSLGVGRAYFWRARTVDGGILGNWVTSGFVTSLSQPASPNVRVREYTKRQFERDKLFQMAATDSGATIAPNPTLQIMGRSLGYRGGFSNHVYSQLFLNEQVMWGYEWVVGRSFMALKVNEFNGAYEFRYFDLYSQPAQADSMKNFIRNGSVGNYFAIVVVLDGRTNVSESLYVAIESLGSTQLRSLQTGQSWAFIGRKGYPGEAIESLTNDSAIVSLQVPNYYSFGSGSLGSTGLSIPSQWDSFHWRYGGTQVGTNIRVALLGVRGNGVADTLRWLPRDSTDINMGFMNALTSGPTYSWFKSAALLSTDNALVTPTLRDWWVDFTPPADLAVSSRTVGVQDLTLQKGDQLNLPVTVHNIGFLGVDSARIVVAVFDKFNRARPIATAMLDTIPVNGTKSTSISIATNNFSRRVTLQINVSPSKKYKDLVPDNNNAYYTFNVVGAAASGIQLFADGVQLMDGDFVASRPKLVVRIPKQEEGQGTRRAEFFVDNKPLNIPAAVATDDQKATVQTDDDLTFTPQLSNGRHELKVRSIEASSFGNLDTLEHTVDVDVNGQMSILKLYNYPNPFSRDTYFTFVLTALPEELHIRIFTIAGRRVKEIVVPQSQLAVNFNRVYWDGRDADGDELANGYYFYKVTIKGEGQTESSIQKLAKIR
jgi:hypothetical protein